jgi:hypothetical protein
MQTYEIFKIYLMMGNIGPLARFDENIGNIQNIFYMMGKQAKNDVCALFVGST